MTSYAYDPTTSACGADLTGSYGSYTRGSTDEAPSGALPARKLATTNVATSGKHHLRDPKRDQLLFRRETDQEQQRLGRRTAWIDRQVLPLRHRAFLLNSSQWHRKIHRLLQRFRDRQRLRRPALYLAGVRTIRHAGSRRPTRGVLTPAVEQVLLTRGDPVNRRDSSGRMTFAVTTARRPPCVICTTGYTLSVEDDEALEEADSLPPSPAMGTATIRDFCVAWLGSSESLAHFLALRRQRRPPGPHVSS